MRSKRTRCGDCMQGEFQCKPSDIYAQAHALQSYPQSARILQRMSVRLRASSWEIEERVIDIKRFVYCTFRDPGQNFHDTKTSALTQMLSRWRSFRVNMEGSLHHLQPRCLTSTPPSPLHYCSAWVTKLFMSAE